MANVIAHLDLEVVPSHKVVCTSEIVRLVTDRSVELLRVIPAELEVGDLMPRATPM